MKRSRFKLTAVVVLISPVYLPAHPMGNFSISHYSGLRIQRDSVELRYLIDMAEIPAFQEMQQSGITASPDGPRAQTYLTAKSSEFANGLFLTIGERPLTLKIVSQEVIFSPGAGDLPTMKLGFLYRATLPGASCNEACLLSYRDTNFPNRTGWKEIVTSIGPGIRLAGGVALLPDRSSELSNYPTDPLNGPPQDLAANIAFNAISTPSHALPRPALRPQPKPAPPGVSDLHPNRQLTPRNAFTQLVAGKNLSFGFALMAALIAAGLGALHALEPGHGKTIVAAYLVGSKGTACHALLLGLIVTASHTAGVYLLGGVTLWAQKYILPDRLYPVLGVLSGILIAGTGFYLFLQRFAGSDLAHSHGPGRQEKGINNRNLAVLGITGGMVPCPAALVVLLSAAALHRVAFGLFLIVAFSLGLAVVLIAMGLAVVSAGMLASRLPVDGPWVQRWLPVSSALMITVLGCVIAMRGLMAAGVVQIQI